MPESAGESFDLVVIGGGTAGLVTAAGAASLGARVALLERHRLGGECLWTGCVPSKALIGSARLAHAMARASDFGLPGGRPEADGGRVLESVREARGVIQHHDDPDRFREMGVDVTEGVEARFTGDGRVEAGGRTLAPRKVVIATGSRPAIPPVDGLEDAGYRTHETAFDRDALPASAIVLGGGAIGVEFAQAYRRLGIDVTLVEMEDRILPREDPALTGRLEQILEDEGVRLLTGSRAVAAGRRGDTRTLSVKTPDPGSGGKTRTVEAEEIFVATGRRPNVESLGLEAVGIETRRDGVVVDDRLRTTRAGVYAAGDVIGGHLFTHVADHEARAVIQNALFPVGSAVDYSVVPWAIYSDPELARVGLTEAEARDRHGDGVGVFEYDLSDLDRAVTDREAVGLVKLVTDRRGRLLGGHILGPRAGSLIVEVALAMKGDLKITDLSNLIHPYPTLSEGVRRAANEYYRSRLTDTTRSLLDAWFRLARRFGL